MSALIIGSNPYYTFYFEIDGHKFLYMIRYQIDVEKGKEWGIKNFL
jgi:hypothetical protein